MNQSLHDLASHDTINPLHAIWACLVPQSGAEFYTFVGEAKTLAKILLAPGGGLSKRHRNLAMAHPHEFVSGCVRGDWQHAPPPGDFHQTTLRWMIKNATDIAIWSAPGTQFADDVAEWGIAAASNGAFTLTIETVAEKAAEWAGIVRKWKKRSASVRFFGPDGVEAAQ
jgi:hypothetical protein